MRDAAIDPYRSAARGSGRARAAGAPLLDDVAGENPVGRAAPRRGAVSSAAVAAQRLGGGRAAGRVKQAPGLATRLRARMPRVKPLKVVTVAAFGVALVGIVANAMVFQRGHHPSPLFGLGHSVDGAAEPAAKVAATPEPAAPAPVERTGTIPPAPAAPAEPAPPAAAPKPAPLHHAPAKPRRDEAAKPVDRAAVAGGHPRPGHASQRVTAEPKPDPVAKLLAGPPHPAKPDAKAAPAAKADLKAAPAAKADLKAAPASKAGTRAATDGKPEGKAAPESPPRAKADAGPTAHPRHRLAAGAPSAAAKPAAGAE